MVFSPVVLILFLAAVIPAFIAVGLWRITRNDRTVVKFTARTGSVVLGGVSVLMFFLLLLASRAMCGSYDFPPVSSPNGHLLAQVNEVDCGAIDSFHSSVEIKRQEQGVRSLLGLQRDDGATVLTVGGDARLLQLEWEGDDKLLIRYPNDSEYPEEFRCQSRWNEVQVGCIPYTPDYYKPLGKMPPVKKVPSKKWFW
jgi:hypothetical protein